MPKTVRNSSPNLSRWQAVGGDLPEQQLRRARDVLSGAGWLFDDFADAEMRRVLMTKSRWQ